MTECEKTVDISGEVESLESTILQMRTLLKNGLATLAPDQREKLLLLFAQEANKLKMKCQAEARILRIDGLYQEFVKSVEASGISAKKRGGVNKRITQNFLRITSEIFEGKVENYRIQKVDLARWMASNRVFLAGGIGKQTIEAMLHFLGPDELLSWDLDPKSKKYDIRLRTNKRQ